MNIRIYFYPRMKIDRCSPRTNCSSVLSASFLMTFYQIQMKKLLISHHLTSKELATLRRCVWPARCCLWHWSPSRPFQTINVFFYANALKPRSTLWKNQSVEYGQFYCTCCQRSMLVHYYHKVTVIVFMTTKKKTKKREKMAQKWQFLCHRGHFMAISPLYAISPLIFSGDGPTVQF